MMMIIIIIILLLLFYYYFILMYIITVMQGQYNVIYHSSYDCFAVTVMKGQHQGSGSMDKMNGGKGRGGARKMPFSPALGRNGINGLAVGQDVAVRWSDGLLYQGNIMKVSGLYY